MKFFRVVAIVVVLFSGYAFGQCNQLVWDGANVFPGVAGHQVQDAAEDLDTQGAQPHLITVPAAGGGMGSLDFFENSMEKACTSWQSPTGGRKSTLIVILVSPSTHQMGIYYGSAWHKALDDHWNRIKQEYMAPRFKAGDFAGGLTAAARQISARIKASQDEALHPAQSTTINQPTDYHGLWLVLGWTLGLLFLCASAGFTWAYIQKKKQEENHRRSAQLDAIARRNRLSTTLLNYKDQNDKKFTAVSEAYSKLAGTIRNDPEQEGLTAEEYETIGKSYDYLYFQLKPEEQPRNFISPMMASKRYSRPRVSPASSSSSENTVVVVNSENNTYSNPEPTQVSEPSPSYDSGSSYDSGGGGSSDFGGSSDSGSGGSSDFGGGGDSGGGGSSSW